MTAIFFGSNVVDPHREEDHPEDMFRRVHPLASLGQGVERTGKGPDDDEEKTQTTGKDEEERENDEDSYDITFQFEGTTANTTVTRS